MIILEIVFEDIIYTIDVDNQIISYSTVLNDVLNVPMYIETDNNLYISKSTLWHY